MTQKDKRAMTFCVGFLALVFGYMGIIDPYVLRYDAAREGLRTASEKLVSLERKKEMLRPRQRKLKEVRDEVDALLGRYRQVEDPSDRLSACVGDFQRCAAASGVTLQSIRPLPPAESLDPNFEDSRFELDFSGPYEAVMRMLYALEAGPYLHTTGQIDLKLDERRVQCRMLAIRSFYRG